MEEATLAEIAELLRGANLRVRRRELGLTVYAEIVWDKPECRVTEQHSAATTAGTAAEMYRWLGRPHRNGL